MTNITELLNTLYFQHTLRRSFSCEGLGLHSGKKTVVTLSPAQPNTGIRLIRTDIPHRHNDIVAHWTTLQTTGDATTLANQAGISVQTVEHLLAALYGCAIDNVTVAVEGPEIPILDGSAMEFVNQIQNAGSLCQRAERKALVIKKPVNVFNGAKKIAFTPSANPWIQMHVAANCAAVGEQSLSLSLDSHVFCEALASARTFGFIDREDPNTQPSFARAGSVKSAVLIDHRGVINPEGLRFADEFVRHKMVDAIGVMALCGARVVGRLSGRYSDHKMTHELIKTLFSNPANYEYMTLSEARSYWFKQYPIHTHAVN